MIAINITPTWEPMDLPTPNLADLEAAVAEAERLAQHAKRYVAVTHAARAHAYAEEARQVLAGLTEDAHTALRSDWQGAVALSRLEYHVEQVGLLARRARRELLTYQRARTRLDVAAPGNARAREGSL